MHAEGRHRIDDIEYPIGKWRHDDFDAMRHPFDGFGDRFDARTGRRRFAELENDLRSDARLHRPPQALGAMVVGCIAHRGIEQGGPDRPGHIITVPYGPVGEPDLAPDRSLALRDPDIADVFGDVI